MKRLVLIVEGEGDVLAVPALIASLLNNLPAESQGQLFLDDKPIRCGGIHKVSGKQENELIRFLKVAHRRPQLGAVLMVLDGDAERVNRLPFCAVDQARLFAERSKQAGAGTLFSFAMVFLRQEYESLLIAVADKPGLKLKSGSTIPPNPENSPRDAKGWLNDNLEEGYRPTVNQAELTKIMVHHFPSLRHLRCFRRLENAITQLASAIQKNQHTVTPI